MARKHPSPLCRQWLQEQPVEATAGNARVVHRVARSRWREVGLPKLHRPSRAASYLSCRKSFGRVKCRSHLFLGPFSLVRSRGQEQTRALPQGGRASSCGDELLRCRFHLFLGPFLLAWP
jgi:hypothetical protein